MQWALDARVGANSRGGGWDIHDSLAVNAVVEQGQWIDSIARFLSRRVAESFRGRDS